MPVQLSQKERMLLQDQLSHEDICIQKYTTYAQQASDPQLKQMFSTYAQQERNHYNTLNQILQGQVPSMQQGQQGGQGQQQMQQASPQVRFGLTQANKGDEALCNDMLMTEKYVSGAYDTAIFEFQDTNIRSALNHIQKEEQGHGEGIFNYMKEKGWYQPQ